MRKFRTIAYPSEGFAYLLLEGEYEGLAYHYVLGDDIRRGSGTEIHTLRQATGTDAPPACSTVGAGQLPFRIWPNMQGYGNTD